ncbi:hypothetical protein MM742_004075 [Salmonella enterica]|nr:hypothetical protein [Salmonella enterica]EIY7949457.1 hypothetical protein [Salmonella enterica]
MHYPLSKDTIKKKILLTGTCQYELLGLWHLLAAQKNTLCCMSSWGGLRITDDWDLIVVTLSAEPVASWGQHLRHICELKKHVSCRILVLVPERLKELKVLRNICAVHSGHEEPGQLSRFITAALDKQDTDRGTFSLTPGQLAALARLSERGRGMPLNIRQDERWLYFHHAQLAANVGVRDFRLLLLTGLDREVGRIAEIQTVNCSRFSETSHGEPGITVIT